MSKKLNLSHGSRLGVEMEMFWIWRRGGEGDGDGERRRRVVVRRVGEEEEEEEEKGTGRGAAPTGRRRQGRSCHCEEWMGTADVDARSGWGCGDVAVTRVSGGDERVDSRKQ
jgi:hypothetical protein